MRIRPLHDRIVVRRSADVETVRGGIHIPDNAQEKPKEGTVLAVGTGKRLDDGQVMPMGVSVGDLVLFGKYSGTEIELGGESVLIMREEELLGTLHPVH